MDPTTSLTLPLVRLSFYVSQYQFAAVSAEATRLGYKNAHRWASAKMLPAIQEAVAVSKGQKRGRPKKAT